MTPHEIRQFADRLRAQAKAVFEDCPSGGVIAKATENAARDVAEWYTAQLQVLADQMAKDATSDIESLDEMLVVRHLSPRAEGELLTHAIDRIINWEVATNLDPTVSSAAQELIARGRADALAAQSPGSQPLEAAVSDAERAAALREAAAWREIVRREKLRGDEAMKHYHDLLSSLASLSQLVAQPRVAVVGLEAELSGLYTHSAASRMAVEARREAFREAAAFLRQWGIKGAPVDAIERKAAEMDR